MRTSQRPPSASSAVTRAAAAPESGSGCRSWMPSPSSTAVSCSCSTTIRAFGPGWYFPSVLHRRVDEGVEVTLHLGDGLRIDVHHVSSRVVGQLDARADFWRDAEVR